MRKLYIFLGIISAMVSLNGCKNLISGYDVDPVNITDPSVIGIEQYLSGAQVNLIGVYEGDMSRLTGLWTGHFSGEDRQYVPLSNYVVSARDFNNQWTTMYTNVLANVNIMKQNAIAIQHLQALGIGQVMQAMTLGLAADLFGDVPYTEALQYPIIVTPKYDSQEAVYTAVQILLDSAITNLGTKSAADVGDADIFFGGDKQKWIQAANTLKARFYLHVKDYANAVKYTDPSIAIASASDNMMAMHGPDYQQNANLFYSFLAGDRPGYMAGNAYAVQLLDPVSSISRNNAKTNEEARLNYLYIPDEGFYDVNYDVGGFFDATSSFPIVTFEENTLIRAEAYAKQNDFDNALASLNTLRAYYTSGANLSEAITDDFEFEYAPYTTTDFAPGGIENNDNVTAIQALIREILEERYITLTGQLEVFNDVRRTHNLLEIPLKSGASEFPQRLLYPQAEINANAANVPQVTLYTPTTVNSSPY
ncbi:SusD/RagB family nutrient-binding outer membrane lipoprotein [Cytophagaceae bacterium DM2B3-1]|uniref:SusD/RagB family nutrient-binding outer membrane lipoprotein n=1 Tax=Xanthocytophaga flava TaxID=3048013 RepID=A0ABT7CJ78_9BACT|nr:SusD/RagB family nutrient-binding outer membrane lipoprotein [Xanthocytophaga flavus]MDJ1467687.1 SusD/RagB family nutrient-binding outer membrane lipoprotein [Xanthocytophaga flavus]MDJ1493767.1 SusD/RagB family nutrient-binding outer membrane lipoprotein [Xanthocytophaga flavus]